MNSFNDIGNFSNSGINPRRVRVLNENNDILYDSLGFACRGNELEMEPSQDEARVPMSLSDIPWQESFSFSAGIDAVTNGIMAKAVVPTKPIPIKKRDSYEEYAFIQDEAYLATEIGIEVSGSFNIEGILPSGSAKFLSNVEISKLSVSFKASIDIRGSEYEESGTSPILTDEAQKLMETPGKFRETYGDYYVHGQKKRARFLAVYNCKAKTQEQLHSFTSTIGVSVPALFSVSESAKFELTLREHNIELNIHVFSEGCENSFEHSITTISDVIKAVEAFKRDVKKDTNFSYAVPTRAKLLHYNSINPNYSLTIPVESSVFSELRQLYADIRILRARYTAFPAKVQKIYRKSVDVLENDIVANQGVLPTSEKLRSEYRVRVDELMQETEISANRLAFISMVQSRINSEPGQGRKIEETKSGPHRWLYGFERSPFPGDVNIIAYTPGEVKKSYKIGHREHNIQFDVKDRILVGWEVTSCRSDGTNGCWYKKGPQNLLGLNPGIGFKSEYDRGFHWKWRFFYVNADEYESLIDF